MVEKLAEMSVDEFFEHGFDSDALDEDGEEEKGATKNIAESKKEKKYVKEKTSTAKPKNQMESLKEKDPEFYKFLQENDEDLLDFSGSESDDEDEEENEDGNGKEDKKLVKKKTKKTKVPKSKKDDMDSEDSDAGDEDDENDEDEGDCEEGSGGEEDEEEKEVKKGRKVTVKMIENWKEGLEKDSIKSLKCVFRAFRAAVDKLSPDEEANENKKQKKEQSSYFVETNSMYNTLMKMCLKHTGRILDKNLTSAKQKKFTSTHLPSSHKLWSSVKGALKQYLHDLLQLLRVHTDVSVLSILLRHCQVLCPYYACFPKISKMLIKRLIRMWSSGEEHVRVLAFLCIRTLSFLIPKLYEFIVKKLYLGFVRNSKYVNLKTKPVITFMKNSLIEMFSYNGSAAYKHGFLYIRQLAITLRNSITVKKKDAYQSVYNWQYISALQLWSQVVSDMEGEVMKPLIYPVVQINLGVVELIPAARYYPLRFHCIESLNYISRKSGVYIPTAAYVLQALESKEFLRKPISSEKLPDFAGVIKLSKSQLHSKAFQDCTIDLALESLLEHYVIFSNSIAFPELIFPICHRMKRLIKTCKVFKLCKDMKMLVDKLQAHADDLSKSREQVTFSPRDVEEVKKWEDENKDRKNYLAEFLTTWREMKNITGSNQHYDEDLETPVNKKGKDEKEDRKRKQQPQSGAGDQDETKEVQKKKKKKPEKERKFDDNENDIVEDYEFSDDDEE